MKKRHIIIAASWVNLFAVNATAETTIFKRGTCNAPTTILLAQNSGAIIQAVGLEQNESNNHVIVFRDQSLNGWASQRLLRRFDLDLGTEGPRVFNSGSFCSVAG